jgi:hypothetical protein
MTKLVRGAACVLGLVMLLSSETAQARPSVQPISPTQSQTFQARKDSLLPNTAYVAFRFQTVGDYISGTEWALVDSDSSALTGFLSSELSFRMNCFQGDCNINAGDILAYLKPGTYYWRPIISSAWWSVGGGETESGDVLGPVQSFTVLPPSSPAPSLNMSMSQAKSYAKQITRKELGASAWKVLCTRMKPSRYFCGTNATRGRATYFLLFHVWHRVVDGGIVASYRVTEKKRIR